MQCVILNSSHEPLALVPPQRGLLLVMSGQATLLQSCPDRSFRSARAEHPVPLAIVLARYVQTGARLHREAGLSNESLFLRDGFTCQYCGVRQGDVTRGGRVRLTRDHVLPTSRGGADRWENVVSACAPCNNRKADMTPEEAGMRLRTRARAPRQIELLELRVRDRLRSVLA